MITSFAIAAAISGTGFHQSFAEGNQRSIDSHNSPPRYANEALGRRVPSLPSYGDRWVDEEQVLDTSAVNPQHLHASVSADNPTLYPVEDQAYKRFEPALSDFRCNE